MRRAFLSILFSIGLALPVQAAKTGYQCRIEGASERSWIQPLIFIAYDEAAGRVVVSDPAILGFNNGVPIEGRIIKDNTKRITFGWQVEMRSAGNQRVIMAYRATYQKASGKLNVSARPRGYENHFSRGGTCTVKPL